MSSVVSIRTSNRATTARPQAGSPAELRFVVLDDGRSLRVNVEDTARYGLTPGETISDELLARLESRDAYLRAREIAVRLLAIRPRSTAELRLRLRQRRVSEEQARAVLHDLSAAGYLDDLAFARTWITGRIASRPCGVKRLRWELREKGVPAPLIEQAIREALGEGDLLAAEERFALALLERRSHAYRRLTPEARLRRIAGFLERRGFASGTIARLLRTAGRTGLAEISTERMDE